MKSAVLLFCILALGAALPIYRSKRQLEISEESQSEETNYSLASEEEKKRNIAEGSKISANEDNQRGSPHVGNHGNLADGQQLSVVTAILTNLKYNITAAAIGFIASREELSGSATSHDKEQNLKRSEKNLGSDPISVFSDEGFQKADPTIPDLAYAIQSVKINESDSSFSTETGKASESDSSASSETGKASESDSSSSTSNSSESEMISPPVKGKSAETTKIYDCSTAREKDQSSVSSSSTEEDISSESNPSTTIKNKVSEAALNPSVEPGTWQRSADNSSEEDSFAPSAASISSGENIDHKPQFRSALRSSHSVWLGVDSGVQNNPSSAQILSTHGKSREENQKGNSGSSSSSEDSTSNEDSSGNGNEEDYNSDSDSSSSSEESFKDHHPNSAPATQDNDNIGENLNSIGVIHLKKVLISSTSSEGQISESTSNIITLTNPSEEFTAGLIVTLGASSESSSSEESQDSAYRVPRPSKASELSSSSEESQESAYRAPSPSSSSTPSSSSEESQDSAYRTSSPSRASDHRPAMTNTVSLTCEPSPAMTSTVTLTSQLGSSFSSAQSSSTESQSEEREGGRLSSGTQAQVHSDSDSSHSSSSKEGESNGDSHDRSREDQSSASSLRSRKKTKHDIPNSSSGNEEGQQGKEEEAKAVSHYSFNTASITTFLRQLQLRKILKIKPFLPILITQHKHAGHRVLTSSSSSSSESNSSS